MSAADESPKRRRRRLASGYIESRPIVKQEPDDDIKDYAETTMNELLGWYGYEKVDSRDTQGLNLQHFTAATSPASTHDGSGSEDVGRDSASTQGASRPPTAEPCSSGRGAESSPCHEGSSLSSDPVARQHQQMVSALSMLPKPPDSPNLPPGCIVCAWCQKVGMKLFTLKTPNGSKAFCSELCFTQCRRASFKKNKVCDWCKHVRHTVNYVDFQDGEQQLQFCSDKCLNQYKMNIFCKETQAHLQMHTHLKEAACKIAASGSVNLITPDLWLRDCKSHSNGHSHPSGENSEMREEAAPSGEKPVNATSTIPPANPPVSAATVPHEEKDNSVLKHISRVSKERDKARRLSRGTPRSHHGKEGSEMNIHHTSGRHTDRVPASGHVIGGSGTGGNSISQACTTSTSRNLLLNGPSPTLSSPPIGASPRPQQQPHPGPPLPSPLGVGVEPLRPPFLPPGLFPPPLHIMAQQQMEAFLRAQHGLGMRTGAPPMPIPPWFMPPMPPLPPVTVPGSLPGQQPHPPQPPPPPPQSSLLPPVTVVVPYPLLLPVPVPIPIPIPIPLNLLDKNSSQQNSTGYDARRTSNSETVDTSDSDKDTRSNNGLGSSSSSRKVDTVITKLVNARMDRWTAQRFREAEILNAPSSGDIAEPMDKSRLSNSMQRDTDGRIIDMDSRSYSPLSETGSTEDDNTVGDDSDLDRTPRPFAPYSQNSIGSSLSGHPKVWSLTNNNRDSVLRSPSPSFALGGEKRTGENQSSTIINNKRKCVRSKMTSV